jgi:aminomethyltransferase
MENPALSTPLESPLLGLHRSASAEMGEYFGTILPARFGDFDAEYDAIRRAVAVVDTNYHAIFSLAGPDRQRYLNAILSSNVRDLQAGQGTVGLLLTAQGHILAEIETFATADRILAFSPAMVRERTFSTLDKFIIMDDVTLTDETQGYGTLALEGPGAATVVSELAGVDLNAMEDFSSADAFIGSLPCTITRKSFGPVLAADILAKRENLESLWEVLLAKTKAAGGGAIGYTALNALRLEQGVPWFGYDFGEKQIPHEATLEDSHISYSKGCYTGQEIVERVRSRGQVNRRRVELIFPGSRVPSANEVLTADGKEVGFVTRASALPLRPFAIGMGYLRKENNAVGSRVDWPGGVAEVAKISEGPVST